MKEKQHAIVDTVSVSLNKRFHKEIFSRFTSAICDYKMVRDGDRVCVLVSGGEKSLLMAKIFSVLSNHFRIKFDCKYVFLNFGYSKDFISTAIQNAKKLGIDLKVFDVGTLPKGFKKDSEQSLVLAEILKISQSLGCNKIAVGSTYDDVITTIFSNMIFKGKVSSLLPCERCRENGLADIIRPLCLIKDSDISQFYRYNSLQFGNAEKNDNILAYLGGFLDTVSENKLKNIMLRVTENDPQVCQNIFKSVENVNLGTVICYVDTNGVKHDFLDEY